MRRLEVLLVAALAFGLSGCVLRAKPKAVASVPAPNPAPPPPAPAPPPPGPLSIPQTNVELPPPQPVTPEAQATMRPPEEESLPIPSPPSRPRRNQQPVGPTPKPETAAPAPAPATTPAEPEHDRPLIRALEDPGELNRLQKNAENTRREVQQLLKQSQGRADATLLNNIQSLLRQSEDAQQRGEMRTASDLADKAMVFARGLPGGR